MDRCDPTYDVSPAIFCQGGLFQPSPPQSPIDVASPSGPLDPTTELEGTWLAVEAAVSGKRAPDLMGQHLRISGDRFQITNWGQIRFGGSFQLVPGRARAKIAFDQTESEDRQCRWLGIYELDGDRLTICDNGPDMSKPWPKSFRGRGQPGYSTVHFIKQK